MITLKNGVVVPCGKCPACLANQRQEWCFRLQQENLASSFSLFVTLTYDDEHKPEKGVNKNDIQLFHKRLRKHFPSGELRFYVVSEYGDHTFRPHYHGLYFFKSVQDIEKVYQIFVNSWQLGFIKFGKVETGSIVYCTKYCLKKKFVPAGQNENFRLMSKMNGGLGSYYLEQMSDFHVEFENFAFVSHAGKKCRMPRYFKDKLSSLYRVYHEEEYQRGIEEYFAKMREEHLQRFKDFVKEHKGLSYDEAINQFNALEQRSHDTRDELILKHTQKQKF